jgi:hypothetical protein
MRPLLTAHLVVPFSLGASLGAPRGLGEALRNPPPSPLHQSITTPSPRRHRIPFAVNYHAESFPSSFWCRGATLMVCRVCMSSPEHSLTTTPSSVVGTLPSTGEPPSSRRHCAPVCHRRIHHVGHVCCTSVSLSGKTDSSFDRRWLTTGHAMATHRSCAATIMHAPSALQRPAWNCYWASLATGSSRTPILARPWASLSVEPHSAKSIFNSLFISRMSLN